MDISEQNICEIIPTIEYCGTITRGEENLRVDDWRERSYDVDDRLVEDENAMASKKCDGIKYDVIWMVYHIQSLVIVIID